VTSDAAELLARRAVGQRYGIEPGASSFFAKPTGDFDPSIIDNSSGSVRPDVREWLLSRLYGFWAARYHAPRHWSTVWIAGSGLTHQWSASRSVGEPGDLDVLIGVDFPRFYAANPRFRQIPEEALAERFNDEFRAGLDVETAATNGITFYVNPGATDIRTIRPYAAFDLTHNAWTVRPPEIGSDWDPRTSLPPDWFASFGRETETARGIVGEVNRHIGELRPLRPGTPDFVNSATLLHDAVRRGAGLFDAIHTDRHKAFGPEGSGYADFYNVRWQAHKENGTVAVLHRLKDLWVASHRDVTERCGGPILDARHALTLASLVGR
jgi:hypothetical protein